MVYVLECQAEDAEATDHEELLSDAELRSPSDTLETAGSPGTWKGDGRVDKRWVGPRRLGIEGSWKIGAVEEL